LAAPLVLDLARIALLAQRRGDAGVLTAAASFFKAPIGVSTHELSAQFALLMNYL
jgi:myo-inositol-1-phosphate synthase